jgi:hypothetical protein
MRKRNSKINKFNKSLIKVNHQKKLIVIYILFLLLNIALENNKDSEGGKYDVYEVIKVQLPPAGANRVFDM